MLAHNVVFTAPRNNMAGHYDETVWFITLLHLYLVLGLEQLPNWENVCFTRHILLGFNWLAPMLFAGLDS